LAAQVMHFAGGRSAGCVSGEAPLAGLHELLRPGVIQALGDPFLAAQLGNAVFPAQTFQHDPDLVLGREVPTRRTPDVLHHPLRGSLGRRFFQGGFGLHLRSFVTTTKPKSSLNHNLKSGPLVLTPDNWVGFDTEHAALTRRFGVFLPSAEPLFRTNSIAAAIAATKAGIGLSPLPCGLADLEADLVRVAALP